MSSRMRDALGVRPPDDALLKGANWVVRVPRWWVDVMFGLGVAMLVGGVVLVVAIDPAAGFLATVLVVGGLVFLLLALRNRHSLVAAGDEWYVRRVGIKTKTRVLRFCDVVRIRGAGGPFLASYLRVWTKDGERHRVVFQVGKEMDAHVAECLLSVNADTDPESLALLHRAAGRRDGSELAGRFVRYDRRGRLRWRRGSLTELLTAAIWLPLGLFWLFGRAPGLPWWPGVLFLGIGVWFAWLLVRDRWRDRGSLRDVKRASE